jgi:hypothetical protein
MTVLFRNQQVAGSIPAGGSMFSITSSQKFSQLSHLSRIFVSQQANFVRSSKSAGRYWLAESITYTCLQGQKIRTSPQF